MKKIISMLFLGLTVGCGTTVVNEQMLVTAINATEDGKFMYSITYANSLGDEQTVLFYSRRQDFAVGDLLELKKVEVPVQAEVEDNLFGEE